NVYPDELEELYRDHEMVAEISIVGLPEESGVGETVAALVRPDYEAKAAKEIAREEVRARILEHMKGVSAKLPAFKRVKVIHLTDFELPKTATRKVKRKEVVAELQKLERLKKKGEEARSAEGTSWIYDVLATVANQPREKVYGQARLEELGFDS